MESGYGGSSGLLHRRRFKPKAKSDSFSPSYGVRMGLIPNPSWPPPPGVEDATERRTARRVPLTFQLGLPQGKRLQVRGNVSAGGALFLLTAPLAATQVDLYVTVPAQTEELHMVGVLIAATAQDGAVVHRVRWQDPAKFAAAALVLLAGNGQA